MKYKIYLCYDHGYEGPLILKKEKKVIAYLDNVILQDKCLKKVLVIEHDEIIDGDSPEFLYTGSKEQYKTYRKKLKNRSRIKW